MPSKPDLETAPLEVSPDDLVPLRERHDGWTLARQRKFLMALAECGSVTEAVRVVGKSTTNAYRLRQRSAAFAAAWDAALDKASALLEAAAYERALKGVEVPVWQGGKLMGYRTKHSDGLLTLLLRARMPERYGRTMRQPTVREGVLDAQSAEAERQAEARRIVHERLNRMADQLLAEEKAQLALERGGAGGGENDDQRRSSVALPSR